MDEKNKLKEKKIFHISFEIALLLKGINAILEVIGGVLLIFLTPDRLNKIIVFLTQDELSEDPKDIISNWIMRLGHEFSVSSQHFGIFYLTSHGIVKLVLIILLWRKKLWAYPLSIVVFMLFIAYQIYKYIINPSDFLILLTVLDVIVIVLTVIEYKNIKTKHEGD